MRIPHLSFVGYQQLTIVELSCGRKEGVVFGMWFWPGRMCVCVSVQGGFVQVFQT